MRKAMNIKITAQNKKKKKSWKTEVQRKKENVKINCPQKENILKQDQKAILGDRELK